MEEENKDKLDNKKNVKESVSCDNNEKGVWEQLSFEFRDWEFDK